MNPLHTEGKAHKRRKHSGLETQGIRHQKFKKTNVLQN